MDTFIYYIFIIVFSFSIVMDIGKLLENNMKEKNIDNKQRLMIINLIANIVLLILFSACLFYLKTNAIVDGSVFSIITKTLLILVLLKIIAVRLLEIFYFKLIENNYEKIFFVVFLIYYILTRFDKYVM